MDLQNSGAAASAAAADNPNVSNTADNQIVTHLAVNPNVSNPEDNNNVNTPVSAAQKKPPLERRDAFRATARTVGGAVSTTSDQSNNDSGNGEN